MADIGRGAVESVVEKYDQHRRQWLDGFGERASWRDNDGKLLTSRRDEAINGTANRLVDFRYNLDIAWQRRLQQTRERVEAEDQPAWKGQIDRTFTRLEQANLGPRLKEWLLEADPFAEKIDARRVARLSERVLEALDACYEIASDKPRELKPDLFAIGERVKERLNRIVGNQRSSEAVNVIVGMCQELEKNVDNSIKKTREDARNAENDPASADNRVDLWNDSFERAKEELGDPTYVKDPYSFWSDTYTVATSEGEGVVKHAIDSILGTRDFEAQLKSLSQTIDRNNNAKDYVLKVRDAAWPVQATIDHYLRRIAESEELKRMKQRGDRDRLTSALCALQDRVQKDVNLIALARFVDQRGAIDEGER
jgi:hypothetical protein